MRRYVADTASVLYGDNEMLQLMFAQRRVDGKGLRSLLVISMTGHAAGEFLQTCKDFGPSLHNYIESRKLVLPPVLPITEEPQQTVSLIANLLMVAQSGRETSMDFFHASAWGFRQLVVTQTSKIPVDPVVRVDSSTALFASVLNEIQSLAARFPTEM